jgi:hypothetical protein
MAPADVGHWIKRYDLADVEPTAPMASQRLADSATFVASSTLRRALSSVRALGRTPSSADAVYAEAALPFAPWRGPRLPVGVWVVLFRLLWFMGYAQHADAFQTTKARAKIAALRLASHAVSGPVLLVGHGIMNRLIGRELIALGWTPTRPQSKGSYWSASTYELQPSRKPELSA